MGKEEFPKPPQVADYEGQKRTFRFFSHTVDTTDDGTHNVEMDIDASFVGIVQLKDSPVFRAVFLMNHTPFEKANKEYEDKLNKLAREAGEAGAEIYSLEDLEKWYNGGGEPAPVEVLDFKAMAAEIEAAKGQA